MIRVEFYGIARARAGVAQVDIEAATLGAAVNLLGQKFPDLASECFQGQQLRSGYLANINGQQFTTDASHQLLDGDNLLILSADAGG
ncbi:MAG: hypothetical protein CMJ78_07375 [Planctomycetaceae bacterium]|nr:hypothetical protein [Planctomycetaceae bacterium]